jgi:predicted dinucleotide-binding enzyme
MAATLVKVRFLFSYFIPCIMPSLPPPSYGDAPPVKYPLHKIGLVGTGELSQALGPIFNELGYTVGVAAQDPAANVLATARHMKVLGFPLDDMLAWADLVVLALPLAAISTLPAGPLAAKIVVDCVDYSLTRSGELPDPGAGKPTSCFVAEHFPGGRVVKAFNTLPAAYLRDQRRPRGAHPRYALPVAADDELAKEWVMALAEDVGFAAVDAGSLAQSWRQQLGQPIYGVLAEAPELAWLLTQAKNTMPPLLLLEDPVVRAAEIHQYSLAQQVRVDALTALRKQPTAYLRGLMQQGDTF